MLVGKYVCREKDFESNTVNNIEKAVSAEELLSDHLEKNTTHVVELVFVWEA